MECTRNHLSSLSSIQVSTTTGDVSILGLDGSFDVAVQKGNITLGINKVISSSKQPMSSALAANGNVHATVDPEVSTKYVTAGARAFNLFDT